MSEVVENVRNSLEADVCILFTVLVVFKKQPACVVNISASTERFKI